jgi:hypothetical protein
VKEVRKISVLMSILIGILFASTACTSLVPSESSSPKPSQAPIATPDIPTQTPIATPTMQISAIDLIAAYDNNAVRADQLYKGKVLDVTGIVASIQSDFLRIMGTSDFLGVYCNFSGSNLSKLAVLSKGQSVTVRGTCDGEKLGAPWLDDCVLIIPQ